MPATQEAVDAYLRQIADVDERIEAAKREWTTRVSAPDLDLAYYLERGLDPTDVYTEGRNASSAYIETLHDAQTELGALLPPVGFEGYHEATRAAVNDARLVAQLMLQACEHRRAVEDVMKAYRMRLAPDAVARTQQRRAEALERAKRTALASG